MSSDTIDINSLCVRSGAMIGRLTGTLLVIADSCDHEEAVAEAKIMLREVASDEDTPPELRAMCRKAAGRKARA